LNTKLLIILITIGISSLYIDFFLSLNAYLTHPYYFVTHEATQDIAMFFGYGHIPYSFIFLTIAYPVAICTMVDYSDKHKDFIYRKEYLMLLTLFVLFIFYTRVLAGLTWYVNTIYILNITQIFSYLTVGGVGTLILLMIKEKRKSEIESHNGNQTSS